jgi:hypothetical protein
MTESERTVKKLLDILTKKKENSPHLKRALEEPDSVSRGVICGLDEARYVLANWLVDRGIQPWSPQ